MVNKYTTNESLIKVSRYEIVIFTIMSNENKESKEQRTDSDSHFPRIE